MHSAEVESLAARWVPGAGTPHIRRQGAGLVNETFRVVRDGVVYALRLTVAHPEELGLDRAWEARVLEAAVAAGLAAAVEYFDPQRGILISRWVEGRSWTSRQVRQPANLRRIADLMRRVHAVALPAPARAMSPANWIAHYRTALRRADSIARPDDALWRAACEKLAELAYLPSVPPVLCHSDLHVLNLVDKRGGAAAAAAAAAVSEPSLVLLDWEYAHGSDPLWDLAGWITNNDLDEPACEELAVLYWGRATTLLESRRLALLRWLYDYVSLMWSEVYLNVNSDLRPEEPTADGISRRARLLAGRLAGGASGRAD